MLSRAWRAVALCSLISWCLASTVSLLVIDVGSSAALGQYPNKTSCGLCFVVAFGQWLCTKVVMGSQLSQSCCLAEV